MIACTGPSTVSNASAFMELCVMAPSLVVRNVSAFDGLDNDSKGD